MIKWEWGGLVVFQVLLLFFVIADGDSKLRFSGL